MKAPMQRMINKISVPNVLCRIGRKISFCGKNIQSPFVYAFITQVIRNNTAYYAYNDLREQQRQMSVSNRRLAKLLFRLANWAQPKNVILYDNNMIFAEFIAKGCVSSAIFYAYQSCNSMTYDNGRMMIVADCDGFDISGYVSLLEDHSVVVLNGIRKSKDARNHWQGLITEPWANISFDLFNVGLIVVAPQYQGLHYRINI